MWSCCVARGAGAKAAYDITTAHEWNPTDRCSSQMDMTNNAKGIAFGLANKGKGCGELCNPQYLKCAPNKPPCPTWY